MKSNRKNIYEKDIEEISYTELGKLKYDFRITLKNGKEVKVKRKLGKLLLKYQREEEKEWKKYILY